MDLQVRIDMGLPSCDGCNFPPAAGTCPGSGHRYFVGNIAALSLALKSSGILTVLEDIVEVRTWWRGDRSLCRLRLESANLKSLYLRMVWIVVETIFCIRRAV